MQCVTISLAAPPGATTGCDASADAAAFADALFEAGALAVSLTPPTVVPPAAAEAAAAAASVEGPAAAAAAAAVAEGGGVGAVGEGVAPIYHEVPPGAVTWATPPRVVWPAATIDATFAAGVDVADLLARLAAAEGLPAPPRYVVRPLDTGRDWVAEVQAGFPPVRVGRLLICYPWHGPGAGGGREEAAAAGGGGEGGGGGGGAEGGGGGGDAAGPSTVVLPIEPGCAFGTGEHPTTRLVLGYLQTPAAAVAGARVLDYGCGSGVLALAAAALGAASVVGVDIDPDAVAVAAANAAGGGSRRSGGVGGDGGVPSPWAATPLSFVTVADEPAAPAAYDVVVANILAAPLIALAPGLRGRAVRGGRLALAGVLAHQAPAVRDAYEAAGWAVAAAEVLDGWVLLTGVAR